MRTLPALIALSLVALTLSACGGGGGSGTAPPPAQTNHTPLANAGSDQTVYRNGAVTLDGSGSTDADGDALAYRWTQTAGPAVSLTGGTSSKPTFTAPSHSGTLTFSLITSDGKVDSAADTISVNVQNRAPQAAAAAPSSAGPGTLAMLDGTPSTDPDGDALTYKWTQLSGPPVDITPVGTGIGRIQVPTGPTVLIFLLEVSDGEATSVQISITINVTVTSAPNRAPVAEAGPDIEAPKRSTVTLYGMGYDPDWTAVSYAWQQTAGPTVTLSDASSAMPSFVAPAEPAQLKFTLTTSDGILSSEPSEVVVDIKNVAPYIVGTSITPLQAYTVDNITVASSAFDADSDPLTTRYEWRRNGTLVSGQTTDTFPASLTTKNDVIVARIILSDGTVETSTDISTTILDSPAVLAATPPTTLAYGATASFSVTATDADGDTIPGIEVAYGPAGFTVTNQGAVTWTAVGPMFDRTTDFNWGLRVRDDAGSLLTGTIRVTDAARLYPVRRTGVQIPIQNAGMRIGDFDGDGDSEMLIGAPQAVFILSKSGSTYQQDWVYPFEVAASSTYENTVGAVAARDLDGDGKQEIDFAKGKTLVRLDGATRRIAAQRELPGYCRGLEIADLEGNGSLELVCLLSLDSYYYSANGRVLVMNATTLADQWQTPDLAVGVSMAVGNVDNDPTPEIVVAGGYVFDGKTQANEWAYSQAFGQVVGIGDMDGNGVGEIVGLVGSVGARAFSAVSKSPLWEKNPTSSWDMATLTMADTNGDGRPEAIVGNGQWGDVGAVTYNTSTSQPETLWTLNAQNHGVSSIAVGDVTGDGAIDIVWGSGASSSGRDDLVVAGFTPTISVEWKSSVEPQLDGEFLGGALARIGGGTKRLMFRTSSTNSGYNGARALSLDPATGALAFTNEIGPNYGYSRGFDVADIDLDSVDELLMGVADSTGSIVAYDFNAAAIEWQSPLDVGSVVALTHADMNADGYPDVIGITTNAYVYVFDAHAQTLLWKSTGLSNGGGIDVAVADLDHDGKPEIVAALGDRIVVYGKNPSGGGYLERASRPAIGVQDLLVADLNGDNSFDICTLEGAYWNGDTSLAVYDSQLVQLRMLALGGQAASLFLEDSAFARKNVLVSLSTQSYPYTTPTELWAIDPVSGAEVWHSPALIGTLQKNSLQFVDLDGDGTNEISFATNNGMNYTR